MDINATGSPFFTTLSPQIRDRRDAPAPATSTPQNTLTNPVNQNKVDENLNNPTNTIETIRETDRFTRSTRIDESQSRREDNVLTREDSDEVRELRPIVIDQPTNTATRAFLDVANLDEDFRLIDIYV